jgi:hypothetical protein
VTGVVCADCGRQPLETVSGAARRMDVFIEMVPGKDGKPWHLCGRCVCDAKNMRVRKPMKPQEVSDVFIDALVATGWTEKPDGQGNTIVSPPERNVTPRARRAR